MKKNSVVPLDSTGISLQQCQPRKRGKLVRKRRNREKRIKANRSSYTKLSQSTSPQGQLIRSRSFHNRHVGLKKIKILF